jgi:protoporphyrinogen oxidase
MKSIVVGGGIAGMTAAYLLSKHTNNEIHLVEMSDSLGGLLKCFDYGDNGKFDYGAHNILESGIEELDNLFINLLDKDDWTILDAINGQSRALTGTYYKGKVQDNTPYIDLREEKNLEILRHDFFNNIENFKGENKTTAYDYSKSIFGEKITNEYIAPIIEKIHKVSSKNMDYMSMFLTPLTRVALFDKNISNELLKTGTISRYLAYPDQSHLSSEYFGTKKTYYPKNYGIYRVVDALEQKLRDSGVKIHTDSQVTNIEVCDSIVKKIEINNNIVLTDIDGLVWSSGLPSIKNALNVKVDNLQYDKPPKTAITNLLIDKKLKVDNLCYIYNYDKNIDIFRIDNYVNYCENAKRKGLYPVSVETLISDDSITKDKISKLAVQSLKNMGVLEGDANIDFVKTEILNYGFPLLSSKNIKSMDNIRNEINDLAIKNLTLVGVLSSKDLFFESDIKKDLYHKILNNQKRSL